MKYCCSHGVSKWQQISTKYVSKEGWFSNVSLWKCWIMSWNVSERQQGHRGCFSQRGRIFLKGPVTIWSLPPGSSLLSRNGQLKRCCWASCSTQQRLQCCPVSVLESRYGGYVTAKASRKVAMTTAQGKRCLPKLQSRHAHRADLGCITWVSASSWAAVPQSLGKR